MTQDARDRVSAAQSRALMARARLFATVAEAKVRLSPAAVASSALDRVKARAVLGVAAVGRHPGTTAVIIGAVGLWLARRPVLGLLRRYATRRDPDS